MTNSSGLGGNQIKNQDASDKKAFPGSGTIIGGDKNIIPP